MLNVTYLGAWQVRQILAMLKAKEKRLAVVKWLVGYGALIGNLEYNLARIQTAEDEWPHYDLMIFVFSAPGEATLVATTSFVADFPEAKELYEYLEKLSEERPKDEAPASGLERFESSRHQYPGTPLIPGDDSIADRWRGNPDEKPVRIDTGARKAPNVRESGWRKFLRKLGILRK